MISNNLSSDRIKSEALLYNIYLYFFSLQRYNNIYLVKYKRIFKVYNFFVIMKRILAITICY